MVSLNITNCPEAVAVADASVPSPENAAGSRPDSAAAPAPPLSGVGAAVDAAAAALAARVTALPLSVPLVSFESCHSMISKPFEKSLNAKVLLRSRRRWLP